MELENVGNIDVCDVEIVQTEEMPQVEEIIEEDKVTEALSENMELETCDDENKETEEMPADEKILKMDKVTTEKMELENVENKISTEIQNEETEKMSPVRKKIMEKN